MGLIELQNIIKATQNPETRIKTMSKIKMGNISKASNNGGNWIGVGAAIGAAVFAATNAEMNFFHQMEEFRRGLKDRRLFFLSKKTLM